MDYLLIASMLIFASTVQMFGKSDILGIKLCATIVTVVPFLLGVILRWLFFSNQIPSPIQIVSVRDIAVLTVQFIAALWIFKMLDQNKETIVNWFAWAVGGVLIIYFVVPSLINAIIR